MRKERTKLPRLLPAITWSLLFCPLLLTGQKLTLSGYIRDTLGQPVDFASIYLTRAADSSAIVAFALSDAAGQYSLTLQPVAEGDRLFLHGQKLSFEAVSIPLVVTTADLVQPRRQEITLREKAFDLQAVIVSSDAPPVQVKRDTIIFQADAFADGREEVVEDLLRKLPGVTVGSNGELTVNGKPVDRVLVENDDLFGDGYTLLTKNLSADLIDEVEVLNRFSDNPLLKGIEASDRTALNLQLKKERVSTLFGNAELGYAPVDFYENRVNLLSFLGKSRYIMLGKLNNTGIDPGEEYTPGAGAVNGITGSEQSVGAHAFLALDQEWPDLKKERYNRNNAEFGTYNVVLNPGQQLKIKALLGLHFDEQQMRASRSQSYLIDTFRFRENTFFRHRQRAYFFQLDADYTLGKQARLSYLGYGRREQSGNRRRILFNDQPFQENLDQQSFSYQHQLTFTRKLAHHRVMQIQGTLASDRKPQDLYLDRLSFSSLFPAFDEGSQLTQTALHAVAGQSLSAKVVQNSNGAILSLGITYQGFTERLRSDLQLPTAGKPTDTTGIAIINHLTQRLEDGSAIVEYHRSLGKSLDLGGSLEGHLIRNIRLNRTTTNGWREPNKSSTAGAYLLPRLQVKWTPSEKHAFLLIYHRSVRNPGIPDTYPGYILTDYRTLSRGTGFFNQLPAGFLVVNYTYGGWAKKLLINGNLIAGREERYLSTNYRVSAEGSTLSRITLRNRDLRSANASVDWFLEKLSGNLKLKTGWSATHFRNVLNDTLPRTVLTNSNFLGIEFRSVFPGWFNVHLGSDWTGSVVRKPTVQYNWTNRSFLDVLMNFSADCSLELNNDAYWFPSGNLENRLFFFSDFSIRYTLKRNALTLRLVGKNLFNTSTFSRYLVDDIQTSGSAFSLLPRYVLLKANFRF